MKKESRVRSTLGSKKSGKRTGRKVKEMHIRPGKSGGYIVKHDLEPQQSDASNPMMGGGMDQNTEEHAVGSMQDLQNHIQQNMPEQMPEEGGEGEQ